MEQMVRRGLRLAACAVLLAAGAVVPARANPKDLRNEGCLAIGTHQQPVLSIRPWDCYYVATGRGTYVAATTNPFVISISKDDGATWVDKIRRPVPGPPMEGIVPSISGDLVSVSISCWDYTFMRPCADAIGGRYGTVFAHSAL